MKVDSKLEDARLTIALDIRHPFCFLALGPALELGRELGIAINWLPREGEPLREPSQPGPDDDRGTRHRRSRAQMIAREIAVYADVQGLEINEPYRNTPADAAHMAWLYMRSQAPGTLEPFLGAMFRRYWSLGLAANDFEALAKLVAEFGGSAQDYLEWAASDGPVELERIREQLDEAGGVAVPVYLTCGQVFAGRQHLPMIRWLLEGEKGPAPI